jgi:NADPH:quinone reductase-like Zn-dependent oxidoreductase
MNSSTTVEPQTTALEIVLPGVVEPDGLQLRHRALPAPATGQVLVAVEATGVSFAEQAMRRNRYFGQPAFPFVPGYDLVGTVTALGDDVDPELRGQRVAALTKTGGWASHVLLAARDLVVVPRGLDPAEVETLVVNGITAWQMLHRTARVRSGQTIFVHGASGGVGTTLVQLARHAGVNVIGAASPRHHPALQALDVQTVDYRDPDLAGTVRRLAPGGVDAAFDNLGTDSLRRSYSMLAPGGTLVGYAIINDVNGNGSLIRPFARALTRLLWWNTLPNGHRASFYNVWSGHAVRPAAFRRRFSEDLTQVLQLLEDGVLTPQIAARMPLSAAAEALALAESRTVFGKIVLVP